MDIVSYKNTNGIPNNHIFNTLMMKYSAALLGVSAFSLRIPVLIAHGIFLWCTAKIALRIPSPIASFSLFCLINLNPYLLDFFSLARGYGYSLTFLSLSVLSFLKWNQSTESKSYMPAMLYASLALLSNFTLLHYFFALCAAILLVYLKSGDAFHWKKFIRFSVKGISVVLLTAIILYEPFRCIIKWKQTFGGQNGFWQDTVGGLIWESFHEASYNFEVFPWALRIFQVLMLGMAFYVGILIVRKRFSAFEDEAVLLFMLCFLAALSSEMQHLLLGTEFLIARTGLFLLPLFFMAFIYVVEDSPIPKKLKHSFVTLIAMLIVGHSVAHLQLSHVPEWKYDSATYQVLETIKQETTTENPVRLGINWIFEPGINFHLKASHNTTILPVTRAGIAGEYDFYYVQSSDTLALSERGKHILKSFPIAETYLLH
jgi:hypothetical protein